MAFFLDDASGIGPQALRWIIRRAVSDTSFQWSRFLRA
jgi:hypothetical protein